MKPLITTISALVIALTVTTGAGGAVAGHHPNARITRLSREVRSLRKQLHHMTVLRDQAKRQIATLDDLLTSMTAQRDAANSKLASLQARVAAIPTPLAVAVEQVRREVYWADNGAASPSGALVAQAAMNYAVGHVSTAAFGYMTITGIPNTLSTPNDILGQQAGVCGKASYAFAAIVHQFGLPVRRVLFYWTLTNGLPDGHTATEVYYGGGWHFFDPTFGVFYRDANGNVLSIADARKGGAIEVKDSASFTNLVEDPWFAGDDVAFELDQATTLVDPGEPFYL